MIQAIFWSSLGWLAYVYAGYPLISWIAAKLIGRQVHRSMDHCPGVTIITAAHNEARHIGATVQNKLELDYPSENLELIVVSDGSIDGTDDIVRAFGSRVTLLRQEPRAGKTSALNMAIRIAHGEILVFSDANSIYDRGALRQIVANFADPTVGYVTGKMVYANPDGSLVGDGCSAYMRYENFLRRAESGFGSVIGVDGGIDAVRRSLYQPMRADQLPDFVLPLQVAEGGHRVVFEPGALLCEPALSGQGDEYRMRVRVALRALWALWDRKSILNPLRAPVLAWQVFSHKVLRYLAFVPLAALLTSSLLLARSDPQFEIAAVVQLIAYGLALAGWLLSGRFGGVVVGFPFYFLMLNVACAHATLKFLAGKKQVVWTPRTG